MVRFQDASAPLGELVRQLDVPPGWEGALGGWLAHIGLHSLIVDGVHPELEPTLQRWLEEAPELVIVATSRQQWPGVEPLGTLDHSDALQLFLDRAPRRIRADAVEGVLARLEGLPLAIELAAARLEVLSVQMLGERLQAPLAVLRDPDGDGPHASLRRTIAICWAGLSAHEQSALAQCSVFAGSIPLDGAEAVVVLPSEAPSVLDVVHRLMRRSLLRRLPGAESQEARFIMFDVVSAFAREQLVGADAAAAKERHGAWYAARLQQWTDDGFHRGLAAARRLGRDHQNLALVVGRSMESGAEERALRVAIALHRAHGEQVPLDSLINQAVAASVHPGVVGRARLSWAAVLRGRLHFEEARVQHELALDSARRQGDRRLEGYALGGLGNLCSLAEQPERAKNCFEAALAIGEALSDPRLQALALNALSSAVDLRRNRKPEAALHKRRRALRLVTELGDVYYQTWLHARVASCLLELGRTDEALREAQAGLALTLDSGQNACSTYEMMARIHLLAGRLDEAEQAAHKSILAWKDVHADPQVGSVPSQQLLALHAIEQGRLGAAVQWLEQTIEPLGSGSRYAAERKLSRELLAGARLLRDGAASPPSEGMELPFARAMWAVKTGEGVQATAAVEALRDGSWSGVVLHRIGLQQLARTKELRRTWRVSTEGRWFQAPGEDPVDLRRRHKLQRLLTTMMDRHRALPGEPVPRADLLEATWPGAVHNPSLHNRLYVAVSTLRRLGFTPLVKARGGYRLAPEQRLKVSADTVDEASGDGVPGEKRPTADGAP